MQNKVEYSLQSAELIKLNTLNTKKMMNSAP